MPTKTAPQKRGAEQGDFLPQTTSAQPATQPPRATGKELISLESRLAKMDEVAEGYLRTAGDNSRTFSSTVALARAMTQLRELMTAEVMAHITPLMNSPLGFLTDRNPLQRKTNKDGSPVMPYSQDVVRDCVIEGALRGFKVVGNELNIIAGRFYGAKAGFERLVRNFPGLTDYTDAFSVPRLAEKGGAVVQCTASWTLAGKPQKIERNFAIKGDSYSTADAYLGKAQRKLAAAVYSKLSGVSVPEGEVGDTEAPAPAPEPAASAMPVVEEEVAEQAVTPQQKLAAELGNRKLNVRWFIQGLTYLKAVPAMVPLEELPFAVANKCVESLDDILEAIQAYELAQQS